MNIKKDENRAVNQEISVSSYIRNPQTTEEMVNSYGTYNIQPTADTENDFPAIAQGENSRIKNRPRRFYRDGEDKNPASDLTDEKAF